ncbi:GDP-fucose protein O-fucosyltransferase 2 isoform X1 [Dermacentor andersoni]|uniref:GDP-fucose protein O-fucosyltransferase 2 isoform X1 n=1 Tax=Dermacentor andersoni TaxID=34620 RepID=UPI0024176B2A|nr:GDP-fucose protein O-fucosyltransferase 2-like isoform X1 [Dermacentor andersoni]
MPALRLIVIVFCIFIDVLSLIVSAVDPYPSCPGANPSQPCSASSVSALEKMLPRKYLLHDVNPGEGFNLRRDVYMRVARLVAALNADSHQEKWTLVLPPWGPLYHWRSKDVGSQSKIRWEEFFDINSLAGYVPVMEFEDYIHSIGKLIDKIFFLQHYPSTFTSSTWVEKYEESPCLEETGYYEESDGEYSGWFWGYYDVTSKEVACLYVQGSGSTLKPLLQEHSNYTAIMLDRAEVILHDNFGDPVYWEIRRSMRFSKRLRDVADKFRRDFLNSDEERDGTVLEEDWKVVANRTKHALGGPYLAVHLRRQDYVKSRPKDVPDLKWAAEQIQVLLEKQGLKKVFVATDAGDEEFQALKTYLPEAVRFEPSKELRKELKDGGLAIVDQWIAAHAREVHPQWHMPSYPGWHHNGSLKTSTDRMLPVGITDFLRTAVPTQSCTCSDPCQRERGSLKRGTYVHTSTYLVTQVGLMVAFEPCSLSTAAQCFNYSTVDYTVSQVGRKTVRYKHT